MQPSQVMPSMMSVTVAIFAWAAMTVTPIEVARTTSARATGPRPIAGCVRHARIEPAWGFNVTHRFSTANLRREETEQRELLHHAEVMRRLIGGGLGRRRTRARRVGAFFHHRLLLAVQRLEQRQALGG
jgi:hypothetical protein